MSKTVPVQLRDGQVGKSIILEQKPNDEPDWCTGKDRFLLKRKAGAAKISFLSVHQKLHSRRPREIHPAAIDMACRTLVRDADGWKVLEASLFDRELCKPVFNRVLAEHSESGVWYRGDARVMH